MFLNGLQFSILKIQHKSLLLRCFRRNDLEFMLKTFLRKELLVMFWLLINSPVVPSLPQGVLDTLDINLSMKGVIGNIFIIELFYLRST